jgi:uncharacterized protein (TIGR01319 family)
VTHRFGTGAGADRIALCADVGSTYTKAAAVDLDTGVLLATASSPTTVDSDVLHGLDAALAAVTVHLPPGATVVSTDVCSSAGGGLRLAVVGYERLVTAEAGRRVGLSAGARVVHTATGRLDQAGLAALSSAHPDLVLLVGGTDGGDEEVLRHNAHLLSSPRPLPAADTAPHLACPVVLAGNTQAREDVTRLLRAGGVDVVPTANVLPRVGVLDPEPARAAIRDVFLRHVIGGKGLSQGNRFASLVRGATPDIVLTAVSVLAEELEADLVVVDVGGATTDVYSVVRADPDHSRGIGDVAGEHAQSRTVEGDLGLWPSAPGLVDAAEAERLLYAGEYDRLAAAAARRAGGTHPAEAHAGRPGTDPVRAEADPGRADEGRADEEATDRRLAELAAVIAVRRHARATRRDLRRTSLLVGSGGAFRRADPASARPILRAVTTDHAGGWPVPEAATVIVDRDYLLAPVGLLVPAHPEVARALARRLVPAGWGQRCPV